jgi:hypothetical protein
MKIFLTYSLQNISELYLVTGVYQKSLLTRFLLLKLRPTTFWVAFLCLPGGTGAYLTPGGHI